MVGSKIVINASVSGSIFPQSEKDIPFPIVIDGTAGPLRVEGSVYGRELELRGEVRIDGPVVVRGDTRISPRGAAIRLNSGITVNGSVRAVPEGDGEGILENIENAGLIVKGDITVNQNVALRDAIVFGSIRAVNCTLERCIVLGTCIVSESLRVVNSSIGGYAARDVTFEGGCVMLHALGESQTSPVFVPFEASDGRIDACDIHFYPAMRSRAALMLRRGAAGAGDGSRLYPGIDWIETDATANPALDEEDGILYRKWVLSVGGRIADYSTIADSIAALTRMLKCGFEFEHYHPDHRPHLLASARQGLTAEETWILDEVCSLEEV
ncbi:MAG: hypothetical protein KGJ57_20660 [Sphingomonadales bacterium]|nr:hypothetical protein [Sphingomonadales bacterium]MDE2171808.1 hypothetical protein [Sphingomonadales bacterium]